jgi:hypothetical protein
MDGNLNAPEITFYVEHDKLTTPFNVASGDVSSGNDINTFEVLEYYREKFEEAWIELANK